MHFARRATAILFTLWVAGTAGTAIAATDSAKSSGPASYHAQVSSQYAWMFRTWWDLRGHQHTKACGHADEAKKVKLLAKARSMKAGHGVKQPAVVPEFDAATAPLSLALLGGLVLLARELRRRPNP